MSAVNQHCQLNRSGTSKIYYLIKGRPYRSTAKKNVINKYDVAVYHREENIGPLNYRLFELGMHVVAVQRNIHQADRHSDTLQALNYVRDSPGQMSPSG